MAIQDTDILEKLMLNYQKTMKILPPPLAEEFQQKIIRPSDLKGYASTIMVAREFHNLTAVLMLQNRIADNFKYKNFGKRVAEQGVDPSRVFDQLLEGFLK